MCGTYSLLSANGCLKDEAAAPKKNWCAFLCDHLYVETMMILSALALSSLLIFTACAINGDFTLNGKYIGVEMGVLTTLMILVLWVVSFPRNSCLWVLFFGSWAWLGVFLGKCLVVFFFWIKPRVFVQQKKNWNAQGPYPIKVFWETLHSTY